MQSTNPATGGEIVFEDARVVNAGLQYDAIPDGVVAVIPVPEPGGALMLVAGSIALYGADTRWRRRARRL